MKFLLVLILLNSILVDFSSVEIEDHHSLSKLEVSCTDIDFHGESKESNQNEDHRDHCHAGHLHTAIILKNEISLNIHSVLNQTMIFSINSGKIKDFLSQLKRPPIA